MNIIKNILINDSLIPKYKDIAKNAISLLVTNNIINNKDIFEHYKSQKNKIDKKEINAYIISHDCNYIQPNTQDPQDNQKYINEIELYKNNTIFSTNAVGNNNNKLTHIISNIPTIIGGGNLFIPYLQIIIILIIMLLIYILINPRVLKINHVRKNT